MDRKVKGYTLIEIAVVLAIIAILAGASVIYLIRQVNESRLRNSTTLVIQLLEEARRQSTTHNGMFGLRFRVQNPKVIEKIRANNTCGSINATANITLPTGIVVNRDVTLLFDRMGYPRNASCGLGMERIELKSEPLNKVKSICINRYGRMRIVEGPTCTQN
ncbi:MAG: Tfp pilus assembly protein FimT/FimU [Aquificaceae bacterium]